MFPFHSAQANLSGGETNTFSLPTFRMRQLLQRPSASKYDALLIPLVSVLARVGLFTAVIIKMEGPVSHISHLMIIYYDFRLF